MKIKLLSFLLYVFGCSLAHSQDVNSSRFLRNLGFSASIVKGYDISARGKDAPKLNLDIIGVELDIINRTDGAKDWQKLYNNPRTGLALSYLKLPTAYIYGEVYSAIPYINFNLINSPTTMGFIKFGIGAAYITNYFDSATNPYNNLISVPYNLGIQIGFGFHQRMFPNVDLALESGVLNFSNGSTSAPNNALNIVYFKGGINYFIYDRINQRGITPFHNDQTKRWYFQTFVGMGYTSIRIPLKTEYNVYVMSSQLLYAKNKIYNIGISADLYYDPTSNIRLYWPRKLEEISEADRLKAALGVALEINLGKLTIPMRGMHYVYNLKNVRVDRLYCTIGLRYTFKNNIFIESNIKSTLDNTSGIRSDFVETGIGFRFKARSTYSNTY